MMTDAPLDIIFMGTPDFAATALQGLIDSRHNVVAVYSQPPRPKGRGHKLQKSPVHMLAQTHEIPVHTPQSLKNADAQAVFAAHEADIAIVAAYGLILPKAVLDAPRHGCLNIHASLLPRWRGASPIQRAIWAGDAQSGVTIMQMDEGLDTGDMLLKGVVDLDDRMTAVTLHDQLAEMGARLTRDTLDILQKDGALRGEVQNSDDVTYAHLLKKSDGAIDWTQTATEISRHIRALTPWPSVWAEFDGTRFKVLDADVIPNSHELGEDTPHAYPFNKQGDVRCGHNTILRLTRLQPEGKKPMDFTSALNGGYIKGVV